MSASDPAFMARLRQSLDELTAHLSELGSVKHYAWLEEMNREFDRIGAGNEDLFLRIRQRMGRDMEATAKENPMALLMLHMLAWITKAYDKLPPDEQASYDAKLRTQADFWGLIAAEFPDDEVDGS